MIALDEGPPVRDIRNDLIERLAAVEGRYFDEMARFQEEIEALHRGHEAALAVLDHERKILKEALVFEAQREVAGPSDPGRLQTSRRAPLTDFIVTRVHARGPLDKEALKSEAEQAGYFDEVNGRSFHTTLVNIVKHGKLTRLDDGRYAFPQRPETLFGVDQPGEVEGVLIQ